MKNRSNNHDHDRDIAEVMHIIKSVAAIKCVLCGQTDPSLLEYNGQVAMDACVNCIKREKL